MDGHDWRFLAMILLIGTPGCTRQPLDHWLPEPPRIAQNLTVYTPPVQPQDEPPNVSAVLVEPTAQLTLRQVMALVLVHNPDLAGFSWNVRTAEAKTLQASLPPNPTIDIEVENIGGSGPLGSFDAAETTISLSQAFLLGEKRDKQIELASLNRDLAAWDYQVKRTEVLVDVTKNYVDVLAAQERVALSQDAMRLATLVDDVAAKRVEAGDASPTEKRQTGVLVATTRIAHERTERKLQAARYRLAGLWGTVPTFASAVGSFEDIAPIPSAQSLVSLVSQNPKVTRWAVELAQRRAAIQLANVKDVPDLEVAGGVRHLSESSDTVFLVGVSLPLSISDRNRGSVLEARYELAKAQADRRAAQVHVETALNASYQELASAYNEAFALNNDVLPAARSAFEAIEQAFEQGKVGYLDVLDAQRTLIDVRTQYIDALASYHRAVAEVEGLVGQSLRTVE